MMSVPSSSIALPHSLFGMVSGQSVIADSNSSGVNSSSSVVARREDSLGRSAPSFLATVFISNDGREQGRVGAHLEPLSLIVTGLWSHQESHLHINTLEMRTVFLAVSLFQSHLRDSCAMVSTDNTSVVTYIQAQGEHILTPSIWKPGNYLVFARRSTFIFCPNIFQVVLTSWRMVCLANNNYFYRIGHFIKK
ncbi:hypothetical protein DPMN_056168 [Dreissena polymorpha]|uniref:Uncharacterized protein n=1 Tax=Dreissena polymorpha TaxID=45954 RepID=A0A9D4CS19_DREPO|nr:hypothetical protein DPMN_056168 [Dreissena polymorpha]